MERVKKQEPHLIRYCVVCSDRASFVDSDNNGYCSKRCQTNHLFFLPKLRLEKAIALADEEQFDEAHALAKDMDDAACLALGQRLRSKGCIEEAIRVLNIHATELVQKELFSILGQLRASASAGGRGYLRNQIEILYNWSSLGDDALDRFFQEYMGVPMTAALVHRPSAHRGQPAFLALLLDAVDSLIIK